MSLREDFVRRATAEGANVSALCREFGISRKTGYKWLQRSRADEAAALCDRSRRPHRSPGRTPTEMEERILEVREAHRTWGPRKIRASLARKGVVGLPSPSTISAILRRHDQIDPVASAKHHAFQAFVMEHPNELWQMDFKGYFALQEGGWCHPLSVVDDHSRFLIGLSACSNETFETVQQALSEIFRHYGLPQRMLMDNGSPWGYDGDSRHTILTAWLIRLGIEISHGKAYHPQTQGKVERFHRTLKEDLLIRQTLSTLDACQQQFDHWRGIYNAERPHEALALQPPATCYSPSARPFPEVLPPVIYEDGDIVRKVDQNGKISFRNHTYRVGKAFRHQPVAIRPTHDKHIYAVFYCHQHVASLGLRKPLR
jgi:transposase InsO family protein